MSLAEILLDHGADADSRTSDGTTPLIVAAAAGRDEMAAFLLDRGADVNGISDNGFSALHAAAWRGHS